MSDQNNSNPVQPSPELRKFGAIQMVLAAVAGSALLLNFSGIAWFDDFDRLMLFLAPMFILSAVQLWQWPETLGLDKAWNTKLVAAILFIFTAIIWVDTLIKFVSE